MTVSWHLEQTLGRMTTSRWSTHTCRQTPSTPWWEGRRVPSLTTTGNKGARVMGEGRVVVARGYHGYGGGAL